MDSDNMSDIITKLYETKISCSNINPIIDDIIDITIAILDFNGNPLSNISITLNVDKGHLLSCKKDNSTTDINTQSYTRTTGSDGKLYFTYKADEWSLCTFSCDTEKLQVFVHGFKKKNVTSTNSCNFWVDESERCCRLQWSCPAISLHSNSSDTAIDTITLPETKYYANANVYNSTYRSDILFYLQMNGQIRGRTIAGVTSSSPRSMSAHSEYFEWHY